MNKRFGSDFQIRANAKEVEVWDAEAGKMVKTGQIEHQAKEASLSRRVDRESNAMLSSANSSIIEGFKKYYSRVAEGATLKTVQIM